LEGTADEVERIGVKAGETLLSSVFIRVHLWDAALHEGDLAIVIGEQSVQVPLSYMDQLYDLPLHVGHALERLQALRQANQKGSQT
jgi:hypothetical protein